MHDDPIIEEIRRIRKEHSDQFNGDIHAIFEDYRRMERESGREYVKFPPRREQNVNASPSSDERPGTASA